jgi:phthiodiolone/phenolphthiodiolone dimycocerosates ketoreductase
MPFKPAAWLRTTLPLDLSALADIDSGRYHAVWLPDHMVSFWPDAIWTPEFTDLATISPSPHRYVDSLAVAGAAAALTKNVPIATCVVDTVRRHPSLLAQTALTLDHLSRGRFILGLGSGEMENIVPYGFDFAKPVSRFEEALKVIRLLWESQGPVNFDGQFYKLHHARLDTEPFEGRFPKIWMGANGPRMLGLTGRYADGWWPGGAVTPEEYAAKLKQIREVAERAGRDPMAITPMMLTTGIIGDEAEVAEVLRAPMVKAIAMQMSAEALAKYGFEHPLGSNWRGIHDLNPSALTREDVVAILKKVDVNAILAVIPHGTPQDVARRLKGYVDAGMEVCKILEYSTMAGLKFAAKSAQKVRDTEDELMRLAG